MAATSSSDIKAAGRDALRFTTDFPILQQYLDPSKVRAPPPAHLAYCLGNVAQLQEAVSQLLEVAIEKGQEDRISLLLDFQQQLENIPARVAQVLGRDVPASEIELHLPNSYAPEHNTDPSSDNADDHLDHLDHSVTEEEDNEEEEEEECPICFEEYPSSDMRVLLGCGAHRYCRTCMDQHFSTLINDASVNDLCCPFPNCSVKAAEYEIESLVSTLTYDKFLQFSAVASLKTEAAAKWCINKDCAQPIVWESSDQKVVCPACKTEFCFGCNRAWHGTMSCEDAAKAPSSNEVDASLQQWMQEKGNKVKPCPRCREGIEKNDGW